MAATSNSQDCQPRLWTLSPMITIKTVIGRIPSPVVQMNCHHVKRVSRRRS